MSDEPAQAPGVSAAEAGVPDAADPADVLPAAIEHDRRRGGRLGRRAQGIALGGIALIAGVALFLSGYTLGARTATTPGTPPGEARLWAPFWDTYRSILERYALGPVDPKTLMEGAIRGMVQSLGDPYSAYYGPVDYKQTLEGLSGRFEGIGAEIGMRSTDADKPSCTQVSPTCHLVVIAPIDGSPAAKAGVRPGDAIERIDMRPLGGMTVDQAVKLIRGPKGTSVVLTLVRGNGGPFELTVMRDVVVQREVTSTLLAGATVDAIRVAGFSDAAASDVVDALRADVAAGRKAVILDLRGNPGGFITAAQRIANEFIASGPLYWTQDATGVAVPTNAVPGGLATDPSIRVVVLIDRGSASASEIVAGALQDTGRALLVGERSYGKGTVQQWQPLENDAGGFKMTIAKWLTPAKRWVHHTGLIPDVAVPVPPSTPPGQDPVLARALQLLGAPTDDATLPGSSPTGTP